MDLEYKNLVQKVPECRLLKPSELWIKVIQVYKIKYRILNIHEWIRQSHIQH